MAAVPRRLFQSALGQVVFVQPEIVAKLMQKRGANFFAKYFLVPFSNVPEVFQKEYDLRGQRRMFLVREFRAGEQTERVASMPSACNARLG